MMRALSVLLLLAGCATEASRVVVGNEPQLLWEQREDAPAPPPRPPISNDEARNIALSHDAGHTCELTARALRARDRARGVAVMEHCVRRPDFTDLETLTAPPWRDDFADHPDLPLLVGHVIAVRGGDVQSDLRLLRRARIPLFSLKGALADPDAYRGRLLLVRGSPRGGRTAAGHRALEIVETRVMAESEWVAVGPRSSTSTSLDTRDSSSGAPRNGFSERISRNDGSKVEVLHNVSVETGLTVLASVAGASPFLEAGTDYVLVLRFDGTREAIEGSVAEERPVATVVGYFEPETGLFARLGR